MIGESHRQAETLASEAASALAEGRKLEALELYSRAAEFERLAFEGASLDKHRTRSILAVSFVALLYKSQQYDKVGQEVAGLLDSRSLLPWAEHQLGELLDSVVADQERQVGLQSGRGTATINQRDRDDFLRRYFSSLPQNLNDESLLTTAADTEVDKRFQEGLNKLLDLSLRTFLSTEQLGRPLTCVGPILEEIPCVSKEDIVVKVGRDGVARFGAYRVVIFFLMAKELAADVYDYNFLSDRICGHISSIWGYRDIVSIRLSERAISCRLPNGIALSRVTNFFLSVSNGSDISVVVGGDEILELTGAQKIFGGGVEFASTLATAISVRVRGVKASLK